MIICKDFGYFLREARTKDPLFYNDYTFEKDNINYFVITGKTHTDEYISMFFIRNYPLMNINSTNLDQLLKKFFDTIYEIGFRYVMASVEFNENFVKSYLVQVPSEKEINSIKPFIIKEKLTHLIKNQDNEQISN